LLAIGNGAFSVLPHPGGSTWSESAPEINPRISMIQPMRR
jgi:hypothetical protein